MNKDSRDNYMKIIGKNLGLHVSKSGAQLTEEDFERLWLSSLDEFFDGEPLSNEARETFKKFNINERKNYFAESIFSLARFTNLVCETLQTHQH